MYAQKQARDIAHPHDDLGIFSNPLVVEHRQKPVAAPTTPEGQHGAHLGIRKKGVDVGGAVLVPSGQVAVSVQEVVAEPGSEPEGRHGLAGDLGTLGTEGGAGRVDQPHQISLFQAFRFDHFGIRDRRLGE